MDTALEPERLDPRCRETHPEHIIVGGKVLERNDITAKRYGESERSVNRRDRLGAPFIFISNIKYRPVEDYDRFVLSTIQQHKPQASRRRKAR